MKAQLKKDTILYKGMARYRIKFLIINVLLTALFILYFINKLPYLKTAWYGESALDVERFTAETSVIKVDKFVELTRKDRQNPDASYLKKTSYWQDDKYRFTLKADKIQKTDKIFKGKVTTPAGDVSEVDMYKLYIAEIDGRKAAVLAFSDQKVTNDMTACIVHMQKPILSGLSEITSAEGPMEFCEYVIDVRGLEMEAETSDHVFFWFYLAALLGLCSKLAYYFINPMGTPTYRQLDRYGKPETVAEEIDRQSKLKSMRRSGKEIVLEGFIISKSFMKLKVVKNHMAKN